MTGHEEQPPDPLLLWCDVEATDVLVEGEPPPAGLEVGWMVTTWDLRQLTPLRQRLVALIPALTWRQRWTQPWRSSSMRHSHDINPAWPAELMCEKVREIHAGSGLERDWTALGKIRDVTDLDELIARDLVTAQREAGGDRPRRVHLAGGGVAQYDARLLPVLRSTVTDWCHYRTADTSCARMICRAPQVPLAEATTDLTLDLQPGVDHLDAITNLHRVIADLRSHYSTALHFQRTFHSTV